VKKERRRNKTVCGAKGTSHTKPRPARLVPVDEVVSSKSEVVRSEAATSEPNRDDGTSIPIDGLREHLVDIA
jgi:hypothetical protein